MKNAKVVLFMVLSSLGGCGAPDGALDESLAQESAPLTDSPFRLRNFQTGLCLGVKAGTPTAGTPLIVWTCDGSANQTWTKGAASPSDPAFLLLRNSVAPDRCLHTIGTGNGAQTAIYTCDLVWNPYNTWKPIYAGNDSLGHECYRFANKKNPARVFGVKGGSTSLGAPVVLWDDFNDAFGHPDQFWCVY
jgi:hypothetical protein